MKHIVQAIELFFDQTLGIQLIPTQRCPSKAGYYVRIDILTDGIAKQFVVALNEAMVLQISNILLLEKTPDIPTKEDLAKEVANIIIGRAKMLFEEEQPTVHYTLTVPKKQTRFNPRGYVHTKFKTKEGGCYGVFSKEIL